MLLLFKTKILFSFICACSYLSRSLTKGLKLIWANAIRITNCPPYSKMRYNRSQAFDSTPVEKTEIIVFARVTCASFLVYFLGSKFTCRHSSPNILGLFVTLTYRSNFLSSYESSVAHRQRIYTSTHDLDSCRKNFVFSPESLVLPSARKHFSNLRLCSPNTGQLLWRHKSFRSHITTVISAHIEQVLPHALGSVKRYPDGSGSLFVRARTGIH